MFNINIKKILFYIKLYIDSKNILVFISKFIFKLIKLTITINRN